MSSWDLDGSVISNTYSNAYVWAISYLSVEVVQQSSTTGGERETNQMSPVDLGRVVSDADTQEDVLGATEGIWSALSE
ncbi:hypothetical protein C446_11877 [Halobiforma nitratireducens JCM 10879]|uniref:Uncharacterized protein n=1 Tax=Halobiforma nitratireducens JCM 10879 TaxID=1227454 RepID=M0LW80_9EURY|nr:hypothetical protein C446_11877 [Halobiforma nitratireducens JCM 10879]